VKENFQRQNACIKTKIIANTEVVREKSKAFVLKLLANGLSRKLDLNSQVPWKNLDDMVK